MTLLLHPFSGGKSKEIDVWSIPGYYGGITCAGERTEVCCQTHSSHNNPLVIEAWRTSGVERYEQMLSVQKSHAKSVKVRQFWRRNRLDTLILSRKTVLASAMLDKPDRGLDPR